VKHYTHLHFFQQLFSKAFSQSRPLYFTDNVSLFFYGKSTKNLQISLTPIFTKKSSTATPLSEQTDKILNWEAAYMQKRSTQVIAKYLNLEKWFIDNMSNNGVSFCWSGNNTESHAFGQAAKALKHATYFGEITNYPQTVYLDPQGTNYFSNLTEKIKASTVEVKSTSKNYIEQLRQLKTGQKHIPQASLKSKTQVFIALYGIQQFLFGSGKRFSVWHRIANKLKSLDKREAELVMEGEFMKINRFKVPTSTSDKRLRILVPLQVNHDTQLHVFSDYKSSFEFIKYLLTIIDSETELHIKLHPAEKQEINQLTIHLLSKLTQLNSNIKLISSFDFADYDTVATINSTFGIDALLSNCKVITFGKSLYSDLDCVLYYGPSEFKTLREALEGYDDLVNPDSFMAFAQAIQNEFYSFNYFGDTIDQGVSEESFSRSITRLQEDISAALLSNYKK
jgi:capsule polysaccharide modification protein KpsS